MAGIGDYEKGKPFTLKSGNKTSYKNMASAPGKLKNFGIAPGDSPYEAGDGEGWKDALKIGVSALTSGLDAVYGSGKIVSGSERLKKCPKGYTKNSEGLCVEDKKNA